MIWKLLSLDYWKSMLYVVSAALVAISVHEAAHGLVSYKLGDPTPKRDGRLTLNPFVHLDLWGTLCMLFFHMGWAKPVRINTSYYKNKKKGIIMVSLAGPLTNYITAFVALILYFFLYDKSQIFGLWFFYLAVLNVGLGTFNLIPIPPLDGSNVLMEIFPKVSMFYRKIRRYSGIILALLLVLGILDTPLSAANSAILNGMWKVIQMIFMRSQSVYI